jgi:hypothetical protein
MSATIRRSRYKERLLHMLPNWKCFSADKQAQLSLGAEIFLATLG